MWPSLLSGPLPEHWSFFHFNLATKRKRIELMIKISKACAYNNSFVCESTVSAVETKVTHFYWSDFRMILKMVSASGLHLFYQPMDEKMKTWTLRFPAKENPNMERALFQWPVVLQYEVKAKHRLISRKFSGMKFFFYPSVRLTNQKPRAFLSVR